MSLKTCLLILAIAALCSAALQVTVFLLDQRELVAGERDLLAVQWALISLIETLLIPAAGGFASRLLIGHRFPEWGATGAFTGGAFTAFTLGTWYFTRQYWWPADEPIVFALLTAIWVISAMVGDFVGFQRERRRNRRGD